MQNNEERAGRLVKKRKTQVAEKSTSTSADKLETVSFSLKTMEYRDGRASIPITTTDEKRKGCFVEACCRASKCSANMKLLKRQSFSGSTSDHTMHDFRFGTIIPPNRSPQKLLAIFCEVDATCEVLIRVAKKLGFDVTYCSSYDLALEEFRVKWHDLIVVDARSPTIDYDTLCRSIRNTKGSLHTAIVAVVKRSAFEKDDVIVSALLDAGYNRCIMDTQHILIWANELIQLRYSDIRPLAQYSTTKALFAAMENCQESLMITDDSCRIQYINSAGTKYFGFPHAEVLGKTVHGQLAYDPVEIDLVFSRLSKGRTWKGQLKLKRKDKEPVVVQCTAVPVTCAGRLPTHFAIVMETCAGESWTERTHSDYPTSTWKLSKEELGRPEDAAEAQHLLRRGSISVERQGLNRLTGLTFEAPITKIINLIGQVQDQVGTNVEIVSTLDKVIQMLRNGDLFSPYAINIHQQEEDIATDLVTALLTQKLHSDSAKGSSRKVSVDSARLSRAKPKRFKLSTEVTHLLNDAMTWEFDILHLEAVADKSTLLYVGFTLITHFKACAAFDCDERTMCNYLKLVESHYRADNVYHNSTHAADVMQAVAIYMEKERLQNLMSALDKAASLVAAACHDLDHPGKSSAFLINSDSALALLYNDVSVLEMHHSALAFQLALGDDKANIFKNLDRDTYKTVRLVIVDMILATEMTKHFEHLAKFVGACTPINEIEDSTTDYTTMIQFDNLRLIMRMMIKCADVSNPTRGRAACIEWTRRITDEYCTQTEEEQVYGLPIVMPMFDRATCSVPKAQIGFYDFIVNDMVQAWDAFIDFPELVSNMRSNYLMWKEFDEQGYSTFDDISKMLKKSGVAARYT